MRKHLMAVLIIGITLGPWFHAAASPAPGNDKPRIAFRVPTILDLLIDQQEDRVYDAMPDPDVLYAGIDTSRLYRFVVVKVKRPDGKVVERPVIPRGYFRRDFHVEPSGQYHDRTSEDSEWFLCEDPQNPTMRGLAPLDIEGSGLEFGVLEEPTLVDTMSGSGAVSTFALRTGEMVIYDPLMENMDGTYEIVGLSRCCGNKVLAGVGRIKRLAPEVVQKIVEVDRPVAQQPITINNITVIIKEAAKKVIEGKEETKKRGGFPWFEAGIALGVALLAFIISKIAGGGDDECSVLIDGELRKGCGQSRDRPLQLALSFLSFSW